MSTFDIVMTALRYVGYLSVVNAIIIFTIIGVRHINTKRARKGRDQITLDKGAGRLLHRLIANGEIRWLLRNSSDARNVSSQTTLR